MNQLRDRQDKRRTSGKRNKPVIGNTLNFQKWKKSLKLWSTSLSFYKFFFVRPRLSCMIGI